MALSPFRLSEWSHLVVFFYSDLLVPVKPWWPELSPTKLAHSFSWLMDLKLCPSLLVNLSQIFAKPSKRPRRILLLSFSLMRWILLPQRERRPKERLREGLFLSFSHLWMALNRGNSSFLLVRIILDWLQSIGNYLVKSTNRLYFIQISCYCDGCHQQTQLHWPCPA